MAETLPTTEPLNDVPPPLVRTLDAIIASSFGRAIENGTSLKSLAEEHGYLIAEEAAAGLAAEAPGNVIVVPFHFSKREANHRIGRALALIAARSLSVRHEPNDSVALNQRGISDDLLDLFAAALLIPTADFMALPESIQHDARALADRFTVPIGLALKRAESFGLVPA